MIRPFRRLFTALTFFTRLPCSRWAGNDAQDLQHAAAYLPLIGILVGSCAAAGFLLAQQILPQVVAVLISMTVSLFLTGALHEDGLSDCFDGLGGGWTTEQRLSIMQDSRIGNFGAIALVMTLLSKYQTLSLLNGQLLPAVLLAGHALSRFAAVLLMATLSYVRAAGKAKALTAPLSNAELLFAAVCGLAPLAFLPIGFWPALLPLLLLWLGFRRILQVKLGGYTGDCLGAMQQLTEVGFYLGVLACSFT